MIQSAMAPIMRTPNRMPTSIATCSMCCGSMHPTSIPGGRLRGAPGRLVDQSRGGLGHPTKVSLLAAPAPPILRAHAGLVWNRPGGTCPTRGRKGTTMLPTLARNWWAIVLRGVFAVLFGLGTFLWPGVTLAVLVLLYGGYLFVDGIMAILWALARRPEGSFSWEVFLAGLASLAAGVVTLLWPGVTAIALLYLIAIWAIIRGVFEILAAFHLRRELSNEWLLALAGAV